jgi:hypothetical protein
MQHVVNQHIVPQFLLKNFSNTNQTHIWSFDKAAIHRRWKNVKNRPIKNTPTEEYFYDKIKGEKIDSFEYKLGIVETNSEPAISKLLDSRNLEMLTNDDRNLIAEFVAYQMLRTKQSFLNTGLFLEDFYNPIEKLSKKKHEGNSRDFWLSFLKSADDYKVHLLNKTWVLTESNEQFYFSDNPVVLQNSTNYRPERGNLGLNNLGIEIYLPLSSSIVLCLFCEKTITSSIPNLQSDLRNIENLNWLQVIQSCRFVFSQNGDFRLIEEMIKENAL